MPTAAEHRLAAASFDRAAEDVGAARLQVAGDRDDLGVRGASAVLVDLAMEDACDRIDRFARHLVDVAAELRRRAVLCDEYTTSVRRYEDALVEWHVAADRYWDTMGSDRPAPWPGRSPEPPAPPFVGAAAG